jgi:uncharacterized protein HemX
MQAATSPPRVLPQAVSPTPLRVGKIAAWTAVVVTVVAILGGVGYWGWNNKVARDEAVQKMASDEAARKVADEQQRRLAAEIKTAQLMLAKHITAEEAEAQSQGR